MAQIPRLRGRSGVAVALFSLLVVVLIDNAHNGSYPTSWGWCVLAFGWVAGVAYFAGRRALDGCSGAQAGLGRDEEGRGELPGAARKSPDSWRIWYDLAIASTGSQRERAFVKAATLNPKGSEMQALRDQGHRLPSGRSTR